MGSWLKSEPKWRPEPVGRLRAFDPVLHALHQSASGVSGDVDPLRTFVQGQAETATLPSWVFLTDTKAWKLKKPVRYDFLDFSTLEARRRDCEEELRLNRRLAADVYYDAVICVTAPRSA